MKILAIRGRNLASLAGDFEVDFTQEPLASAGIFAITGNTGSGKSTLLDAMCIALFATSPRINTVSYNSAITDAVKFTIKERDCRNILRKGTGNGYAEVDFKALDGKNYRARWSVKRARDNSYGKMQDAENSLFNLTDNIRIEGGKTEVLARITDLIGLTYEQFTRAVLLAQGEFATFLKATPKDKAEILEKLTGTDIYSKISAKIYEHCKEAANEVKILEDKIKETALLTEDELTQLVDKQKFLEEKLQDAEKQSKLLESQKGWFERHTLLTDNLRKSSEEYTLATENFNAAKGTIEKLALIDSVQEIRDTYMSAMDTKVAKEKCIRLIEDEKKIALEVEKNYTTAQEKVTKSVEAQEKTNEEWIKIRPKINEAHQIVAESRNTAQKLKEAETETNKSKQELQELKKAAGLLKKNIEEKEKELSETDKWFTEHDRYATIIPKAELVLTDIKDAITTQKQIENREKLLAQATSLLAGDEKRLKEIENEAERLEKILPAEVATLRSKLVEGEPCPVCGSRHHSITIAEEETLKEEQLANAKKEIQKSIENTRASIEENKKSINSHKAYIESLKENIANCNKRLNEILRPLESEKMQIDETLAKELQEIVALWEENGKKRTDAKDYITQKKAELATNEERAGDKKREGEKQEEIAVQAQKELLEQRRKIEELIGKDCLPEDIEKQYSHAITKVNSEVTTAMEYRNNILAEREKLRGSIAQAKKSLDSLETQQKEAKDKIETYLNERNDGLTLPVLHSLITTETAEVTQMRNHIDNLRNRMLTAQATYKERLQAMEEHAKETAKPADEESADSVKAAAEVLSQQKKQLIDEISTTRSKIKLDEENKKKQAQHIADFAAKEEVLSNWKILNDAFGSAEGDKFKIIAQGYTLDILLHYANIHLLDISQRYKLARTAHDSLAIKVIDTDIMDEERSVYSLSGGETFLVSLALALALSSLSSNRMNIESLFIDEGFGALDHDTLRTAMDALERLQGQGRKVGVISHLQDMIERIPTKIKIIKEQEGKSHIEVAFS